jgi:hypothetical protein
VRKTEYLNWLRGRADSVERVATLGMSGKEGAFYNPDVKSSMVVRLLVIHLGGGFWL